MLNNDRLLVQILLLGLLAACLWVLAPFASALFWAAVLAFASWPVMRVLTRWLNGNATLAAGLLTFSWMVLVAVPLVWLGFNIADQIRDANALLHDLQVEGLPPAPAWLGEVPLIGDALLNFWSTVDEQGTALIASKRTFGPQAASRSPSGSSPLRLTWITSTPCGRNASQTTRLEGNSSSLMTTWSPGFHSSPKATKDSASEVFLTSAMSAGVGAFSNLARRFRRRVSTANHCG